jgi:hypothetical protein
MGPERVTPLKPMNAMSVKVANGSVCSNKTKIQDKKFIINGLLYALTQA